MFNLWKMAYGRVMVPELTEEDRIHYRKLLQENKNGDFKFHVIEKICKN